jgi:low affinity Fe/Cu permease
MWKRLYEIGCQWSATGSRWSGHPLAILLVLVVCGALFAAGGPTIANLLTLILSVLSITLTQMVLNQGRLSEKAIHLKIDELIHSIEGARDEVAGIEQSSEDEIERLRR